MLITFVWKPSLLADMHIEITCGVNTAHPIAVIPFTYINNQYHKSMSIENIASIIAADLRNSSKFNTIPVEYLPHKPTKVSDVIPTFWEKLGINIIVLGTVHINYDENYIISYHLVDTSSNPALIILENQYSVEKKWLRYVAHAISNEIFEKLTGIKGVFCTRIAYILRIYNDKYPYELYVSDYDGHNPISICRSTEPLMSPAWSPDGKKIAYVTFSSGHSELVVQALNTGLVNSIISFPNHNGAPSFSPDSKKIAFSLSKTGSLNLYIMDLESGEVKQLTKNRNNNTEPSWFPDNQNIAYTSDQGGKPQIYKINIKTTEIQRLSWLHTSNQNPSVSSDGTFLIMVNRHQGKQNIAKLNLLTGQEEILTDTLLADTPSIAPNNTMVVYSNINKDLTITTSHLELISVDGHFKAHIQKNQGDIRFPTWSPLHLE
ncbi:Tol-Pal system beta propeller repeat protein TolB [Blochmannia endosymbiont of Camponotus sp. C-003]|uniref:Tol-Pal system beta propeller repeat protein TolB n=1 Tax=unclassified Candidatus Blochmanniella TaxID=711328 RepID=UPI002024EFEC|nr:MULTISPECIES: Tol-Pal system beta propeller repeat protein TolB [unclassified Candidatus Blochmannia]URJ23634.1 Tol-Pal system beta propeller repeat protein TolB [Blochmannia endosymbiont of Camponotus sp. C-003]URJ29080.1 Tol-Pal system beta propeller repeat protein TolB [Blochmannia endosymbiont of Camponotus sp. C-046]